MTKRTPDPAWGDGTPPKAPRPLLGSEQAALRVASVARAIRPLVDDLLQAQVEGRLYTTGQRTAARRRIRTLEESLESVVEELTARAWEEHDARVRESTYGAAGIEPPSVARPGKARCTRCRLRDVHQRGGDECLTCMAFGDKND